MNESKGPSKIDDKINLIFENIVAEYQSNDRINKIDDDRTISNGDSNNNIDDDDKTDKMIEFLCLIGRLKSLPRRGWIFKERNIQNPESIAGHMYRMAIMSMLFDDDDDNDSDNDNDSIKINFNKMVQMSLIHDMAECIVGDITPMDGVKVDDKHRIELDCMEKLVSLLPSKQCERLIKLYKEYESHQSMESILVKELDRFDICLQAYQYEQQEYFNNNKRILQFDEFFRIAVENIRHPILKKMVTKIVDKRNKFWNKTIKQ